MQRRLNTSPTMVDLGKRLGISPVRLEHATRSIFGGTGESITSASDAMLQRGKEPVPTYPYENAEKAAHLPFVGPLIRRFVTSPTDQRQIDMEKKFYEAYAEAGKASNSINSLISGARTRDEAADYYLNHPRELALADAHAALAQAAAGFSDYRKAQIDVASDATEKRSVEAKRSVIHENHELYIKALQDFNTQLDQHIGRVNAMSVDDRKHLIEEVVNRANRPMEPDKPKVQ
jgi:hypothetical protein